MKKIKISIICILIILCIPIIVEAATIDINLKAEKQNYEISENENTITITMELGDFVNLSDGEPLGYSGTLEYNQSIFQEVSVEGLNGWSVSFNSDNNMILGDTSNGKANEEIAKITFKVKDENVSGKNTTIIRLKDIIITNGNFEISADKQIEITLNNKNNETTNQKVQQIKEVSVVAGEETISATTSTTQNQTLPDAGIGRNVIVAIIVLTILMIIFKIKSRKIKY